MKEKMTRRDFLKKAAGTAVAVAVAGKTEPAGANNVHESTELTTRQEKIRTPGKLPGREIITSTEYRETNPIQSPTNYPEIYHHTTGKGELYPPFGGSERFTGDSQAVFELEFDTHSEEVEWLEFAFTTQSSVRPRDEERYNKASLFIKTDGDVVLTLFDKNQEDVEMQTIGTIAEGNRFYLKASENSITAKIGDEGQEHSIEREGAFQHGETITPLVRIPNHTSAVINSLSIRHKQEERNLEGGEPPLRDLAQAHDMKFGMAAEARPRFSVNGFEQKDGFDHRYPQSLRDQTSILVDKAAFSWGWHLRPNTGEINTADFETSLRFAKENDMAYRAYLVSTGNYKMDEGNNITESSMPDWIHNLQEENGEFSDQAKELIKQDLDDYLDQIIDRGAGSVDEWICASELLYKGKDSKNNIWLKVFDSKDHFVKHVFTRVKNRLIENRDENAKLMLMFDGGEGMNDQSDAIFDFTKKMKLQGTPIDILGMEAHFQSDTAPSEHAIRQNIRRLKSLDLEVAITEYSYIGPEIEQIAYARMMAKICKEEGVSSFVTWGFIHGHKPTKATGPNAEFLDADYNPTPQCQAFREELAT